MEMKELMKQARAHGVMLTTVNQSADMFKKVSRRRRPAFEDWIHRLSRGDRLPRGRYFRGKQPGRPLYVVDEFRYWPS